jgi:hypothetical protein
MSGAGSALIFLSFLEIGEAGCGFEDKKNTIISFLDLKFPPSTCEDNV